MNNDVDYYGEGNVAYLSAPLVLGGWPVRTQNLEYANESTKFVGYLARDGSEGRRPGVIVFPEAFGLNDHTRERAEQLARLGYVALAADVFGGGAVYDEMSQLGSVIGPLYANRPDWRSRARAAFDALVRHPQVDDKRIAAIGFCFGGTTAIELARTGVPLAAVTTFHSGFVPELPEDVERIRAKVLICHGAEDPFVKKEAIETLMTEFRRDRVDWQFIHYGNTFHSFTNRSADARNLPALKYNKTTDERSWKAMRQLFDEVF